MSLIKIRIVAALVLTLAAYAPSAFAQQGQPSVQTSQSDNYVTEKGFRSRVFEMKHRDPDSLHGVLRALGSGFKGATMSPNREFKTLTVRDFPENIAAIEEAIKRLDNPENPQSDIELRIHILTGSNTEAPTNQYPSELNEVIKQLQATLNYKNYSLLTSIVQRAKEGTSGVRSSGTMNTQLPSEVASLDSGTKYSLEINSLSLDATPSGVQTVQIGTLNFNVTFPIVTKLAEPNSLPHIQYENGGIRTAVSVRDGERVVIGTASLKDKGLIVVLSARVIK